VAVVPDVTQGGKRAGAGTRLAHGSVVGSDEHRGVLVGAKHAAPLFKDLARETEGLGARLGADAQFRIEDAEREDLVVGEIGAFLDPRDDPDQSLARSDGADGLAHELADALLGNRALALHDDLVERRLGREAVAPALEAQVPGRALKGVSDVLDQPARHARPADASELLCGRCAEDLVGAEGVQERGRR
jgi:hypothetical protein